ncbi:SPOR domain-containing protein [Octadecabacter sp.]|nr:SPOR domain-containing protein [Octadecabacter sp.]
MSKKKNVLSRDNLSGIEANNFWTIYLLPAKIILWFRYIAAPKGKVFATARQAKSPIVTFLTATLFWFSFLYIAYGYAYKYFHYEGEEKQVSLDNTNLIPLIVNDDLSTGLPKVQLGAYSTYDGAIRAWRIFNDNYSEVFAGREYRISQIIINEQTLFRLAIVGFGSERSADQFCKNLNEITLDCFLVL